MFGILPFQFRFRGKLRRLFGMYLCFIEHGETSLHPTQISRDTGMSLAEAARRLEATPELFVKLPRRPDGVTRYRLTSAISSMGAEDVEKFLHRAARRESALLWAFGFMLLCVFLIVVVLIGPAL